MRFLRLLPFFLLTIHSLSGQTIQDLNKAAKKNASGNRPSNYGSSYYGSSNDAFAAYMLVRSLIWMGQGMVQLGREQVRLASRNKEENHLFCLDIKPQAGYGLTGFVRLQPQIRANIGWLSLDVRQSILQDAKDDFRMLSLMFWVNFWNKGKFRFRAGLGGNHFNSGGDANFQYSLGAEFIPSSRIRFELEAVQSQRMTGSSLRPIQEIQFRAYHPLRTKGILQLSIFGGVSSQKYFSELEYSTLDAGLNFRLSASKFR